MVDQTYGNRYGHGMKRSYFKTLPSGQPTDFIVRTQTSRRRGDVRVVRIRETDIGPEGKATVGRFLNHSYYPLKWKVTFDRTSVNVEEILDYITERGSRWNIEFQREHADTAVIFSFDDEIAAVELKLRFYS